MLFVVDSGARCHIVGDKALSKNFHNIPPRIIALGEGRLVKSSRCGNLRIAFENSASLGSSQLTLKEVLFSEHLDCNLLSCSKLAEDCFSITFAGVNCALAKGSFRLAAILRQGIYELRGLVMDSRLSKYLYHTRGENKCGTNVWVILTKLLFVEWLQKTWYMEWTLKRSMRRRPIVFHVRREK